MTGWLELVAEDDHLCRDFLCDEKRLTLMRFRCVCLSLLFALSRQYENFALSCCPLPLVGQLMPSNSESGILTIKEVAEYLKVTERTIYRLAAAKKIPGFKLGGTWRFRRSDLDEWIAANLTNKDSGAGG